MRPPYRYRALQPNTIRLLRILPDSRADDIKCELGHCPIEGTEYTALSYCWGDPKPVAQIQVNRRSLSVAKNLWQFLECCITAEHVRRDIHELLWIDAVCIDQSNMEEKSAQVNIMWSIYERANQVIAWLGDVAPPIERALSVARALDKLAKYSYDQLGEILPAEGLHTEVPDSLSARKLERVRLTCGYGNADELFDDIASLTHHDYFQRMWTYQEVIAAARDEIVSFKTTSSSCSLAELWALDDTPHVISEKRQVEPEIFMNFLYLLRDRYIHHADFEFKMKHTPPEIILRNALEYTEYRQCLDPRDKVFALLGLPGLRAKSDELKLVADYTMSPEDVLIQVLLLYEDLSFRSMVATAASESRRQRNLTKKYGHHSLCVSNAAWLLFRTLGLNEHSQQFCLFRDQAGCVRERVKNGKILFARSWVRSYLCTSFDPEAEGVSNFLKAAHRYWQ